MLFKSSEASKLERLSICMMILGCYSLIATVFIPRQIEENPTLSVLFIFLYYLLIVEKEYYVSTEPEIAFMPLLVKLTLAIKSLLLIIAQKCFCYSDKEKSKTLSLIIDIIFACSLIAGLVVALTLMIGLNRLKSDIWTNNLMNGLGQGMTTLPILTVIAQLVLKKAVNADYVTSRPSLQKKLEDLIIPDIKSLLVSLMTEDFVNYNLI